MTTAQKQHYYSSTAQKGTEILQRVADDQGWIVAFPDDQYSPYDAVIIDEDGTALVEVKVRTYDSDAFKDWMMETKKLQRIREICPKDVDIVYVCAHPDGKVRFWDVESVIEGLEKGERECKNLGRKRRFHQKIKEKYDLPSKMAYYEWTSTSSR